MRTSAAVTGASGIPVGYATLALVYAALAVGVAWVLLPSSASAELMHLYLLPLAFALAGLAIYTALGGADFGAGFWQLVATDDDISDEAHHANAPVWEANHVWLIYVLTVMWTAYPSAFGSIASTLSVPLFIAGIGIVLRGGAYALRSGTQTAVETRRVDTVVAVSSILTPFALGTVVGGIASRARARRQPGREPDDELAEPDLDHHRRDCGRDVRLYGGRVSLRRRDPPGGNGARGAVPHARARFRRRRRRRRGGRSRRPALRRRAALPPTRRRPGLPALIVSVAAGAGTLALIWRRRYEPARYYGRPCGGGRSSSGGRWRSTRSC